MSLYWSLGVPGLLGLTTKKIIMIFMNILNEGLTSMKVLILVATWKRERQLECSIYCMHHI